MNLTLTELTQLRCHAAQSTNYAVLSDSAVFGVLWNLIGKILIGLIHSSAAGYGT